jgi:hypothetical protein
MFLMTVSVKINPNIKSMDILEIIIMLLLSIFTNKNEVLENNSKELQD